MTYEVEIHKINSLLPSKRALYDMLKYPNGGFQLYLPKFKTLAVSVEWLLQIVKTKVISIKLTDVKPGQLLFRVTKWELAEKIENLGKGKLGFIGTELPEKEWLVNVLHTLKPDHRFFMSPEIVIKRSIPTEYVLFFKGSNSRIAFSENIP